MFNLLLIDVAACVALIMVAAFVMVMRWHRRGRPLPMLIRRLRRTATPDRERPSPPPAAVVPGFSREGGRRGARQEMRPAGAVETGQPAQASQPQRATRSGYPAQAGQFARIGQPAQAGQPAHAGNARQTGQPALAGQPAQAGRAEQTGRSAYAGQSEQPEQVTRRGDLSETARPEPPGGRPGAAPDKAPNTAVSSSERIDSYYDEADRAMSDYLAAMGWVDEPGAHDGN
jgi:hypothetical protein